MLLCDDIAQLFWLNPFEGVLIHWLPVIMQSYKKTKHDNYKSSLSAWFQHFADRCHPSSSNELLISDRQLNNIAEIMSDEPDALFPKPFKVLQRSNFGQREMKAQLNEMYSRRLITEMHTGSVSRTASNTRGKRFEQQCWAACDVFEWIWDTLAGHIDVRILSLLPVRDHQADDARRMLRHGLNRPCQSTPFRLVITAKGWPQTDEDFAGAARNLVAVMPAGSESLLLPQSISKMLEIIADRVMLATGVDIDQALLQDHIAPICQLLEPTEFLAMTIARCDIMSELIGKSLTTMVRRHCMQYDWQIELPDLGTNHNLHSVLEELLQTRSTLVQIKGYLANDQPRRAIELCGRSLMSPLMKPRMHDSLAEKHYMKTRELFDAAMMIVSTNIAISNVGRALAQAANKFTGNWNDRKDTGLVYNSASAFLLTLADALELYVAAELNQAAAAGSLSGFSFVSDESPPRSKKYSGLRFQITWVFCNLYADRTSWDTPRFEFEPPMYRRQYLCDIVHCPGKTGDVVFDVLMKQWARYQLYPDSCHAGVGDGGGENEGCNGVHALLENRHHSYVRRRCLLHLPWRIADQGLAELGVVFDETKSISTYLHEGSTWTRMKAFATTPRAAGGLGLCTEGDELYTHLFRTAPPKHQQDRPATTCELMQWLQSRDHHLAQLARADASTRKLVGQDKQDAIASLCSGRKCVLRRIGSVLINKGLFLFHYTEKHQHLTSNATLSELFKRYSGIMTDLKVDRHVLDHLGISEDAAADLLGGPITDASWVELAVHMQPNMTEGEKLAIVDECFDIQKRVCMRMSTHLSLMGKNIHRTTWLAARLQH